MGSPHWDTWFTGAKEAGDQEMGLAGLEPTDFQAAGLQDCARPRCEFLLPQAEPQPPRLPHHSQLYPLNCFKLLLLGVLS